MSKTRWLGGGVTEAPPPSHHPAAAVPAFTSRGRTKGKPRNSLCLFRFFCLKKLNSSMCGHLIWHSEAFSLMWKLSLSAQGGTSLMTPKSQTFWSHRAQKYMKHSVFPVNLQICDVDYEFNYLESHFYIFKLPDRFQWRNDWQVLMSLIVLSNEKLFLLSHKSHFLMSLWKVGALCSWEVFSL